MFFTRAFTLIELLITISILSILTGSIIILIKPQEMRNRAQDAVRKQDVAVIAGAFERYYADNNSYPSTMPTAGSDFTYNGVTYLQVTPTDPDGAKYTCKKDAAGLQDEATCIGGQSFRLCATLEVPGTETNPFCISNAF